MGDSPQTSAQGQSSGPHWSKDYVEHLRTIHFSLIALSLAAIVLATSANPSEITKAREQIRAIGEVTRTWNGRFVEEAANRTMTELKVAMSRAPTAATNDVYFGPLGSGANALSLTDSAGNKNTYGIEVKGCSCSVQGPIREYLDSKPFNIGIDGMVRPERPRILEDFHNLWDALNKNNYLIVPEYLTTNAYRGRPLEPVEITHANQTKIAWTMLPLDSPELKHILTFNFQTVKKTPNS